MNNFTQKLGWIIGKKLVACIFLNERISKKWKFLIKQTFVKKKKNNLWLIVFIIFKIVWFLMSYL